MGAVKESIMLMGEKGFIPIGAEDQTRWEAAIGRPLSVLDVKIELRGKYFVDKGLPWEEAYDLANDDRISAVDRDAIRFLLEVGGLD